MYGMSDREIKEVAPSIFAMHPRQDATARYEFIPTIHTIQAMRGAGFYPMAARQNKVRQRDPNYCMHSIRFRAPDFARGKDGLIPEAMLINSHDRTTPYKLLAGLFRMLCENGLVVADGPTTSISIKHFGQGTTAKVIEGSKMVIKQAQKIGEVAAIWKGIDMTDRQRTRFAIDARTIRFGEGSQIVEPKQLLDYRRTGDAGTDLWHTFNVVQENCIKGELEGSSGKKNRRVRTRAISGISADVGINSQLWGLAERTAKRLLEDA